MLTSIEPFTKNLLGDCLPWPSLRQAFEASFYPPKVGTKEAAI